MLLLLLLLLILEIKRQVLVANNIKEKKSNICLNLLNELFIDFCFFFSKKLKTKEHTHNITINSKLRLFILKKERAVKFLKKISVL